VDGPSVKRLKDAQGLGLCGPMPRQSGNASIVALLGLLAGTA
jgi:hypothetical protein